MSNLTLIRYVCSGQVVSTNLHLATKKNSPSVSGGYTRIPKSSSIAGRSVLRTDSRASPLTRGPLGGRPGYAVPRAAGTPGRRPVVLLLC